MKKITLSLMLLLAIILLPSVIFAADGDIAKIGEDTYPTIQKAIDSINSSEQVTITLIGDETTINGGGFITNGENIVIDFNKKTYIVTEPLVGSSGTESNGCQLLKGSTVKFTKGTFTSEVAGILVKNYCDFTLVENMTLKAEKDVTDYALSNNCGTVNINGSIFAANNAFDMCWAPDVWGANTGYTEGTQITVNTKGTIKGNIELGTWGSVTEPNKANVKSTLKIDKIGIFDGHILVKKDYLKNQLTVSKNYDLRETDELEYILAELNSVTIAKIENGKVTANKSVAAYEDLVELSIVPDAGYIVKEVVVLDNSNKELELIEDYKFSMPKGPVTVTVVFEEILQDVEAPTIDTKQEFKEVTLGVSNLEEANKTLLDSLLKDKDFENIQDENVKIDIGITNKEFSNDLKSKMVDKLSTISNKIKLSNCFDISISVKDLNDSHLGYLTNLSAPIEFTVALPPELQQVIDGYTRKFYMVYEHNGEVKTIDDVKLSDDGKFATFLAYEFSSYAIAYEDVKDVTDSDVPKTGDNIAIYSVLAVLSAIGVVALKKVNKSKKD